MTVKAEFTITEALHGMAACIDNEQRRAAEGGQPDAIVDAFFENLLDGVRDFQAAHPQAYNDACVAIMQRPLIERALNGN